MAYTHLQSTTLHFLSILTLFCISDITHQRKHVVRVPFGASYIHMHVKGPFSATRNDTIKNSQNTTDAFNMTGHDFPTGYRYEVCVTGPLVERTVLSNCTFFYYGSGGTKS